MRTKTFIYKIIPVFYFITVFSDILYVRDGSELDAVPLLISQHNDMFVVAL